MSIAIFSPNCSNKLCPDRFFNRLYQRSHSKKFTPSLKKIYIDHSVVMQKEFLTKSFRKVRDFKINSVSPPSTHKHTKSKCLKQEITIKTLSTKKINERFTFMALGNCVKNNKKLIRSSFSTRSSSKRQDSFFKDNGLLRFIRSNAATGSPLRRGNEKIELKLTKIKIKLNQI